MRDPIHDYYSEFSDEREKGHFHKVIALHETLDPSWEEFSAKVPLLPRGWFELAKQTKEDRIEFTRDYWLSKLLFTLPSDTTLSDKIAQFFDGLEDVGIFVSQTTATSAFEVHMVYGLKENRGFFHGSPPASRESLGSLIRQFAHVHFPLDYLAFFEVHDGFCKYVDTGLIKTRDMARIYQRFIQMMTREELFGPSGEVINPQNLIPFYESFGLHCYQCFYTDWYCDEEIGNVYFSLDEKTVSNFLDSAHLEENLAFPTFLSWLLFYLEDVNPL